MYALYNQEKEIMMYCTNKGSDETWKRIPEDSVGVELGVWKGGSSQKFLRKAGHLHLVDPWAVEAYEDSDEFGTFDDYLKRYAKLVVGSNDPKDFQKYYDNVYKDVKKLFKDSPVTIHRCTTDEFFENFNEKIDWIYVDALHSFDGCLSDLRNSLKIVKSGGSIFGDDYGNKQGVVKAVDAFIEETGLMLDNFYQNQYEIKIP